MLNKIKLLSVLFVVLFCSACTPQLKQGTVVNKAHEPERTYVSLMPIMIGCGKNCFTTMMIPYSVYDDEDFILTVKGITKEGKEITELWYVNEKLFNNSKINQEIIFSNTDVDKEDALKKLKEIKS